MKKNKISYIGSLLLTATVLSFIPLRHNLYASDGDNSKIILEKKGKNKSEKIKPEIVDTKTFSCLNMDGFTFEYPVFKLDFESYLSDNFTFIVGTGRNECAILLNTIPKDLPSYAAQIKVIKRNGGLNVFRRNDSGEDNAMLEDVPGETVKKNPNGILYDVNDDLLTFWTPEFTVEIIDKTGNTKGFSRDQFFTTVIASFKLENGESSLISSALADDLDDEPASILIQTSVLFSFLIWRNNINFNHSLFIEKWKNVNKMRH